MSEFACRRVESAVGGEVERRACVRRADGGERRRVGAAMMSMRCRMGWALERGAFDVGVRACMLIHAARCVVISCVRAAPCTSCSLQTASSVRAHASSKSPLAHSPVMFPSSPLPTIPPSSPLVIHPRQSANPNPPHCAQSVSVVILPRVCAAVRRLMSTRLTIDVGARVSGSGSWREEAGEGRREMGR